MKRCPECRRDYFDDSLLYCLDDGAALLEGPKSDEDTTALLTARDSSYEAATQHLERVGRGSSASSTGLRPVFGRWIIAAAAGLILIGTAIGIYLYKNRTTTDAPFTDLKITKLTTSGNVTHAVVSPDGKQVVYVVDDGAKRTLWLRHVATGSDVRLTAPEDMFFWALTISPDGNYLYYAYGGGGPALTRDLYQLPVLGGTPKKVVQGVNSQIGFAPDGTRIAFVRNSESESMLVTTHADGTDERIVSVRKTPNTYGSLFHGGVGWSPDGSNIASIAQNFDSAGEFWNVVEVPAAGGAERSLTNGRWYEIDSLSWLSDRDEIIVTAAAQQSDPLQIWRLPYTGGEPVKITNDLDRYSSLSLNSDSKVIVSVQTGMRSNISVAPDGDKNRLLQLTSSATGAEGAFGLAWTHDGKLVYHSYASGAEDIWIMNEDGSNRTNMTADVTTDYHLSVSTDGRYIVFVSERAGNRNIWRMDTDGRNPMRLTTTPGNNPSASSDWVVYQAQRALWKIPINGGEPVRLRAAVTVTPSVSPDGRLIACSVEGAGIKPRLTLLPMDGGEPVKFFDADLRLPAQIRWSPDGRSVTYVSHQNGVSDIWSQPIDGGAAKKITDFKASRIFYFDWSKDNVLAISMGASISDVVLIRDVK